MTSPAGPHVRSFQATKTFVFVLVALAFAVALSFFAAASDFTAASADVPRLTVVWGLLGLILVVCFVAAIGSRKKTVLSRVESLFGVFTAACVFFVALYSSTKSWPSDGLGPALGVTTLTVGTSAIFIRLLVLDATRAEAAAPTTSSRGYATA